MHRIIALLASALAPSCSSPASPAGMYVPPPCASLSIDLGEPCEDGGICSSDGDCLPPCSTDAQCPNHDHRTCEAPHCLAGAGACSYAITDGAPCGDGGVCKLNVCE